MAEWDDAPLLSPEAAPKATPTPAPVADSIAPWDAAPILASGARAKATVNANVSADDAGNALKISKQTGIPPTVVQTDMPGYTAHARTQDAIKAVANPAIASYIDKNPMASQVSNDDYETLDRISPMMSALDPQWLDHAATAGLLKHVPAIDELMQTAPGQEKLRGYMERMKAGFVGGFGTESDVNKILRDAQEMGLSQNVIDFYEGLGLIPVARATEAAIRLVPGIIGGAVGLASGAVEQATGSSAWADRLLREAPAINAALMGEAASPLIQHKPAPLYQETAKRTTEELHQFVAEHTEGGPRAQALSAGETPADQLWQAKPVIDQAKAETAGDALDAAVEAAQESKTKARSPELFEKYLEAHGDKGTVHIPAQAILDLYKREGKVPIEGDGLFGFVPGILDKATLAAETGAEVKIPLTKYIAHVDETVHTALADQVRVQEKGVTREESKAAVEEQKAKIEAYHGTPHNFESFDLSKIGTGEGAQVYGHGLYFAENKAVSTNYAEKLAPTTVEGKPYEPTTNPLHALIELYHGTVVPDRASYINMLEDDIADMKSTNRAGDKGRVEFYQKKLDILKSGREIPNFDENKGQLYKVQINADPMHFLDWDKPLSEQPELLAKIPADFRTKLEEYLAEHDQSDDLGDYKGGELHKLLERYATENSLPGDTGLGGEHAKEASEFLNRQGIPGIKYLDQGSRGKADGTRNFVVFDDKLVRIIEKNDNPIIQAVEAATEAAKVSLGLRPLETFLTPLFKDGEAVNITKPEFKKYSDLIDRAQEHILTKAVALAKREASKRLTPEWKANEAIERDNTAAEMWSRPDFEADRFFNQGLNSAGEKLRPELRVKLGEVKADEWAPIFGFESGSDMVMAVIKLEQERADTGKGPKWQFNQHVDAETAKRMEAKYGHLNDNIALEASEAALADYHVDLLATEWKLLAEANGREPPLSRSELADWAKDQFNRATASEVSYETWRRAAEKGGRETEKALLKKDYVEAFNQKQKQMLSFLLAREAKGFEKEVARAERLFGKYADEINLPAVDQAFTDQIHRLLQQYGIETKRTIENTDYNLQGKDFSSFVRDRNANGAMIVQAELPTPRSGSNRPIDAFTVDQYRDFATMIKSLDHNGRAAKQIEVAGKKEAFNEVIDKIAKNLDTLEKNDFDPTARGVISRLRALGREVDSRLLKAEKLIDWIDKKDPLGAFNSSVLRGLIEGEQAKGDMITKLAKMAGELPGDRAWGKALNDLTTNKELLDWETGKPKQLTNENKIAIALNYGNKSNRRILLEGYKWTEQEVETYLAREMTPMDKAVVDGIHGLFEPLAPLVEKATSSRAGVAIPLIEGTPHNGMKGGYYPLMEDPRSKLLGQQVDTDLFQKTKFDPLPTANALKQRTGKVYPIDLSIGQIHARLSQTAHAVFMQEPVINANKVISDPVVREGIDKAFGPEYVKMLDKWIRDIADNGGSDVGFHDDKAAWLSRNLRQNVVVQLMGWKASTALIHGGSAAASSMYELGKMRMDETGSGLGVMRGPDRLIQEISRLGLGQFLPDASRRFFGSQSAIFDGIDFVLQNSSEMRNRQRSLAKDFGFQLEKITNSSLLDDAAKVRAIHQTYSMAMVAYLDQLTATPVWRAAYDKALVNDGLEHADAVYVADKAVREAHGSASLVSRANIGRGEINKWLTIAYNGYWNHNYNKMREAGKEVAGYDDSFSNGQRVAIGAAFMTAMIVAPALVHHAVRGGEEETTGKAIGSMLISQFGGTVPIVNALTYSMIHNRDPSVSPIEEVLKSVATLGKDAGKEMAGKEVKHPVKDVAKAGGFLTGLPPTNQAIDTFSFMNDVLHRREDPKTVQEWARGLMTGHAKPKAH